MGLGPIVLGPTLVTVNDRVVNHTAATGIGCSGVESGGIDVPAEGLDGNRRGVTGPYPIGLAAFEYSK